LPNTDREKAGMSRLHLQFDVDDEDGAGDSTLSGD
jgi:hypothetical protein